jgi:hypothetical protein
MSRRDDQVYFKHMLDHAREAADMMAGKSRTGLRRDRTLELALVRHCLGRAGFRHAESGSWLPGRKPKPKTIGAGAFSNFRIGLPGSRRNI